MNSQQSDRLLQQDEEWLESLKESLTKSHQLKTNMLEILDSFESRLENLEGTILPLYKQSGVLQRRQQNVTKTLKSVDKTLNYYHVANEVDSSIKDSEPGADLDKYLATLDKLQDALKFFTNESKNVHQAESIRGIFDFGCHSLQREFQVTLRQYVSVVIKPTDLMECIGDGYELMPKKETLAVIPDATVEKLAKISNWLFTNGATAATEILATHAEYRSGHISKSLQSVHANRKANPTGGTQLGHSPAVGRKDSMPATRFPGAQKKISRAIYAADPTYRRQTLAVEHVTDPGSDADAETYVMLQAALVLLFQVELDYVKRIFPEQQRHVVQQQLVISPANFILSQGEALVGTIRKGLIKHDFASILCLLPITKYSQGFLPQFQVMLQYASSDLRTRYVEVNKSLASLCYKGLEDFVEHVKTDQDRMFPKDGTVHQLTSNALFFMEQLVDFRESLGFVLGTVNNEPPNIAVPQYFARVLSALGLSLRNRAELYSDPFLKAIFMLNNYNHLLKTLQKSGIIRIVSEFNRDVVSFYQQQIRENKAQYLSCWVKVASFIPDQKSSLGGNSPLLGDKLRDKDRQMIKDAFANFNKEFETLSTGHRNFSIPDLDLAAIVRTEVKDIIVPHYQHFYTKWSHTGFSKNPEKYLKYTPAKVESDLDRLFDSKS